METRLANALLAARDRLAQQRLLAHEHASLSLRLADAPAMLFLPAATAAVQRHDIDAAIDAAEPAADRAWHAAIYRLRADVGAIAVGGGRFGRALADFGGVLPAVFDEQVRHLGCMRGPAAAASAAALGAALREGGNVFLLSNIPVCLGVNCQRMVFNAELFEKCAKAYVLAAATGQKPTTLPWWVRRIANGRLKRDERRAAQRFAQGLLPEEAHGY
jgi:ribulose-5-phosphate 4-epimerase/fuculose-1-phosphate aldolase